MNPILRETLDRIKKHIDITEGDEIFLTREIGYCMSKVAYGCKTNPDFNICGGEYVDENSYIPDNYLYKNVWNNENTNS